MYKEYEGMLKSPSEKTKKSFMLFGHLVSFWEVA